MDFWTSDTHFDHAKVIEYSKRPFTSVDEMNQALIDNINTKVTPKDTLWHLGDFAFASADKAIGFVQQIKCRKVWIPGNHDKKLKRVRALREEFEFVAEYYELEVPDADASRGKQLIVMSHFPMITWNKAAHGAWMVHGHCHGTLKYPFPARIVDVGVDNTANLGLTPLSPVSYDELKAVMATRPINKIDHHGD